MSLPPRFADSDLAALMARRADALARFARWEAEHPRATIPSVALEGIGTLYELLPAEARGRPAATAGVARLHRLLKTWTATNR